MPVHGVTQRGEVAGERHAGSDIVPQTAHPMDLHLGLCDVRGDTEIRQPQVLEGRRVMRVSDGNSGSRAVAV